MNFKDTYNKLKKDFPKTVFFFIDKNKYDLYCFKKDANFVGVLCGFEIQGPPKMRYCKITVEQARKTFAIVLKHGKKLSTVEYPEDLPIDSLTEED